MNRNNEMEKWAMTQVWPSLESISLKCPRPHAHSGGYHWWYNDSKEMERKHGKRQDGNEEMQDHVPIICKTCGLRLKLSASAPEYPAV